VSVPLLVGFDPSSKKPAPMEDALISKPPGVAVMKVTNQFWDGYYKKGVFQFPGK
jgi:hypothetical protein